MDDHEHTYGPFEWSHFGGSYHRKCTHTGCKMISLDGDDGDDENE